MKKSNQLLNILMNGMIIVTAKLPPEFPSNISQPIFDGLLSVRKKLKAKF